MRYGLDFDEKSMQRVISGLEELRTQLPGGGRTLLAAFPWRRSNYHRMGGLIAAKNTCQITRSVMPMLRTIQYWLACGSALT